MEDPVETWEGGVIGEKVVVDDLSDEARNLDDACRAWLEAKFELDSAHRALATQAQRLTQLLVGDGGTPLIITREDTTYLITREDRFTFGYVQVFTPAQSVREEKFF